MTNENTKTAAALTLTLTCAARKAAVEEHRAARRALGRVAAYGPAWSRAGARVDAARTRVVDAYARVDAAFDAYTAAE